MSVREDVILWLDLETTGSSPDSDILEVGVLLTTTDGAPVNHFSAIITPREFKKLFLMDPIVVDIHYKSGLLNQLIQHGPILTLVEAEIQLTNFIKDEVADWKPGDLIPLAGSGVSHFDRQFIRRDWPMLDKMLTYWSYDVGVIRRTLRLAKWKIDDSAEKPHRALEDARMHAEEFQSYLKRLQDKGRLDQDEASEKNS